MGQKMTTSLESRSRTLEPDSEKIVRIVFFIIVLLYICDWAWKVFWLIRLPYTTEYRDLATIQLTELFSRNVNPYSPENSPPFFYLYGFLFSLVVSLLARLANFNLLLLHKVVTLLCVLCVSFLVSLEVRRNTKSLLLQTFGFALMLTTSWNAAPFIIRPDSFGLLIILLIPFILRRNNSFPAIAISAFLTIASFYTKQYFIFIAASVFMHELFEDWRKAVYYIAVTLLVGTGSFFLVRAVFPNFFYASLVAQANSVGGSLRHLLLQSLAFAARTWPLFLLMCYPVGKKIIQHIAGHPEGTGAPKRVGGEAGGDSSLRIYYCIFSVAAVCIVFIGTNKGAWLSYYYQLALPSMTIVGLSMLAKIEHRFWRAIFLLSIAVASLFFVADAIRKRKFDIFPPITKSEKMPWERAYSLLDQKRSSQMLLAPIFADYICRNGLEPVDNGNTEYYTNLRINNRTIIMKVLGLLLPDIGDQFGRYVAWRVTLSENVREQRYSIIAITKKFDPLVDQDDLDKYYHRIDEVQLHLADEYWTIVFWIPNR